MILDEFHLVEVCLYRPFCCTPLVLFGNWQDFATSILYLDYLFHDFLMNRPFQRWQYRSCWRTKIEIADFIFSRFWWIAMFLVANLEFTYFIFWTFWLLANLEVFSVQHFLLIHREDASLPDFSSLKLKYCWFHHFWTFFPSFLE